MRGNTLTFFATDPNELAFTIHYRPKQPEAFEELKAQFKDRQDVAVEQRDDAISVIVTDDILFPSGSVGLSDAGKQLIQELASDLVKLEDYRLVVEGHTDDVPIVGDLASKYPSNWELSSARALNVVHALTASGFRPERMQAHAFGPYKPRKPNNNKLNRSANRRIEILLHPLGETKKTVEQLISDGRYAVKQKPSDNTWPQ